MKSKDLETKNIKGLEIYTEKNKINGMYILKAWASSMGEEYLIKKSYDVLDDSTYEDFYNYVQATK